MTLRDAGDLIITDGSAGSFHRSMGSFKGTGLIIPGTFAGANGLRRGTLSAAPWIGHTGDWYHQTRIISDLGRVFRVDFSLYLLYRYNMEMILGSRTKAEILRYLGLRGGRSGRTLARELKISPTPVFKALHSLCKAGLVSKSGPPYYYSLNPKSPFYEVILQMIYKDAGLRPPDYLPRISKNRRVDPLAIYRLLGERGTNPTVPKLSKVLREKYD